MVFLFYTSGKTCLPWDQIPNCSLSMSFSFWPGYRIWEHGPSVLNYAVPSQREIKGELALASWKFSTPVSRVEVSVCNLNRKRGSALAPHPLQNLLSVVFMFHFVLFHFNLSHPERVKVKYKSYFDLHSSNSKDDGHFWDVS